MHTHLLLQVNIALATSAYKRGSGKVIFFTRKIYLILSITFVMKNEREHLEGTNIISWICQPAADRSICHGTLISRVSGATTDQKTRLKKKTTTKVKQKGPLELIILLRIVFRLLHETSSQTEQMTPPPPVKSEVEFVACIQRHGINKSSPRMTVPLSTKMRLMYSYDVTDLTVGV